MVEGQKYYSEDGMKYTDANGNMAGEGTIHFNTLNLLSKTDYTAEQLDQYLTNYPQTYAKQLSQFLINVKGLSFEEAQVIANISPLAGLGITFKEMEVKYGVNALYLMAHAIHESAWGTSHIAQINIIFMVIDAGRFGSIRWWIIMILFRGSIEKEAAKKVSTDYLNPS